MSGYYNPIGKKVSVRYIKAKKALGNECLKFYIQSFANSGINFAREFLLYFIPMPPSTKMF